MAPPGKKEKKEVDPEVLMRLKFRAKCRFRAIGRMVLANAYWMVEAVDQYEGFEDTKRRVEQAIRSKAKKKQLLSVNDKALLNKPASDRTDEEKRYIYRIIGGLKCFKRYPNHVKKKLAAVTYFKYYGPNRVIVRQHQEAHAMYFIATGDIVVSQLIWDDLLNQHVSVDIGIMGPGDMFGEVSLLHNICRTATCTTNGHCELLCLMKEDFKNVLQASVQKQWDEVRHAMSAFTYFDGLDEVARREGCIVAKMKSYQINETLLGDGVGVPNFVYFILSGRCQMIESMNVIVTSHLGRQFYSLYDPFVPKVDSDEDFDAKYFGAYKTEEKDPSKDSHLSIPQKKSSKVVKLPSIKSRLSSISSAKISVSAAPAVSAADGIEPIPEELLSANASLASRHLSASQDILQPDGPSRFSRPSVRLSLIPDLVQKKPPSNIKTYFMQVCQMNAGASFGFGENMRDRRIIALTPVDCMLMPKIWLLQRNTANIWSRIQHYLEKKIPTKKQLFKEFVSARRWTEFRDQLVEDVVARSNTVNYTTIHDVPYSIRMEEMLDI